MYRDTDPQTMFKIGDMWGFDFSYIQLILESVIIVVL